MPGLLLWLLPLIEFRRGTAFFPGLLLWLLPLIEFRSGTALFPWLIVIPVIEYFPSLLTDRLIFALYPAIEIIIIPAIETIIISAVEIIIIISRSDIIPDRFLASFKIISPHRLVDTAAIVSSKYIAGASFSDLFIIGVRSSSVE